MRLLSRAYPADSLVVQPFSLSFGLVLYAEEDPGAVHHVVLEAANVLVAVRVRLEPFPLHFALPEVSFVSRIVGPDEHSLALHIVVVKFALVELARVSKEVLAEALELAVHKVSFVEPAIELKLASPCLLSFIEVTRVPNHIEVPALDSVPMLFVVHPISFVHAAVIIDENAKAVSFSIFPFTLVYISICMSHPAFAIVKLILGLAHVNGAVAELDDAEAFEGVFVISPPLTFIFLRYFILVDDVEIVWVVLCNALEIVDPMQ